MLESKEGSGYKRICSKEPVALLVLVLFRWGKKIEVSEDDDEKYDICNLPFII